MTIAGDNILALAEGFAWDDLPPDVRRVLTDRTVSLVEDMDRFTGPLARPGGYREKKPRTLKRRHQEAR